MRNHCGPVRKALLYYVLFPLLAWAVVMSILANVKDAMEPIAPAQEER